MKSLTKTRPSVSYPGVFQRFSGVLEVKKDMMNCILLQHNMLRGSFRPNFTSKIKHPYLCQYKRTTPLMAWSKKAPGDAGCLPPQYRWKNDFKRLSDDTDKPCTES